MRVNILFRRYLVLTVATAIILLGQQGAQAETAREWFDKGMDLTDVGMYEEALEAYDRALELNPNDAIAWNNKGPYTRIYGERRGGRRVLRQGYRE